LMFGIVGKIAGAIEGVSDLANKLADWLRQRGRDQLVRKAENADDKQRIIERHNKTRAARARARLNGMLADDPANRDRE